MRTNPVKSSLSKTLWKSTRPTNNNSKIVFSNKIDLTKEKKSHIRTKQSKEGKMLMKLN